MSKDGESYNSPTNVGAGNAWNPFGLLSQGIQDTVNIVNGWLTNLWQRQSNRDDYRRSRDDARYDATIAYQRQLDLLNNQRAYDDPSAQMARYVAAGLHPGMVAGGLSGPAPAQVQQSHGGTMNGASASAVGQSLLGANYLASRQLELESRKLDLEERRINKQNELDDATIIHVLGRDDLSKAQIDSIRADIDYTNQMCSESVARISNLNAQTYGKWLDNDFSERTLEDRARVIAANAHISEEQAKSVARVISLSLAEAAARINNLSADTKVKESQKELNDAQRTLQGHLSNYYVALAKNTDASTALLNVQVSLERAYGAKLRVSQIIGNGTVTNQIGPIKVSTRPSASDFNYYSQ